MSLTSIELSRHVPRQLAHDLQPLSRDRGVGTAHTPHTPVRRDECRIDSAETEYVRSNFRLTPRMLLDRWLIVFAALFIYRTELGKADESLLPVDELVQRVIVQEQADRQHQAGLEYSFTLTTEHYDANARRTSAQTVRASAKAKANIEYTADLTSESNGAAKNHDEASQGLKDNQSLQAQLDLTKLAPRFVYSIRGAAEVEGRDCWVVGYRPKTGTSANSREEKVINALRGRLWIDKETFSILRCDGKTVEPVTVALIATVDSLEFSYQSQRLPNGEVVPQSFEVAMTVKAPFFYARQRQVCTLNNFHKQRGG